MCPTPKQTFFAASFPNAILTQVIFFGGHTGMDLIPQGLSQRERNKAEKEYRIVQAARELFVTIGYDKTTMAEVARRAGIGKGTLFLYVRDKRGLLFRVVYEDIDRTMQRAYATVPPVEDVVERIMHVFTQMFDMYEALGPLGRHFVREQFMADEGDAVLQPVRLAFLTNLCRLVENCRAANLMAEDVDSAQAAYNAFALYFGALTLWLGGTSSKLGALASLRSALLHQEHGWRPPAVVAPVGPNSASRRIKK